MSALSTRSTPRRQADRSDAQTRYMSRISQRSDTGWTHPTRHATIDRPFCDAVSWLLVGGVRRCPPRGDARPVPAAGGVVSAQAAPAGVIEGAVTTQSRTVPLAGAVVTLRSGDHDVATLLADADGRFRFQHVPDGRFQVVASLDGFTTTTVQAVVSGQQTVEVSLDLPITSMTEHVEVVAPITVVPATGTLSGTDEVNGKEIDQMTSGGGFQAALRLLASVIEVPGGVSIKGGRPSQSSVQIGPTTLVDPSTGLTHVSLPDDAIDSVAVLPNPYAVEFGRFSSGLVVIQTRRAGDQWHTRLNNLDPAFRTSRTGNPFDVLGISYFSPRLETGGPIIKDRLFLEQTAQFRYSTSDVPSRPQNELKTDRWFSTFTRVDANLSPEHSLMATSRLFSARVHRREPRYLHAAPRDGGPAQQSQSRRVHRAGALDRLAVLGDDGADAPLHQRRHAARHACRWSCCPETTDGNFYNTPASQHQHVSMDRIGVGIEQHVGRAAPLQVRRRPAAQRLQRHEREQPGADSGRGSDGTLARRLDFGPTDHAGGEQHGRRAVPPGSDSADDALVCGARRTDRSRRRHRSVQRDAAHRDRGAAERVGHLGGPRRLRAVLRADAFHGRRVQRV